MKIFAAVILILFATAARSQFPMQGGMMQGKNMNAGRFYGRVLDAKTNKGIEFATVQLFTEKKDSVTQTMKPSLAGGQITDGKGNFSIDKLNIMAKYTLKISAIGYKEIEQSISFQMPAGKINEARLPDRQGNFSSALSSFDKDLGNFKLEPSSYDLSEVTVTETTPVFEMKIDKKVYNVDKDLSVAGGTAEDVLKKVPSVNVDIEGNVTMRNASPQIFVDGRPTTLTIDQIPADAMQKVEVITNPSAKYDASGGQGGILNIVLKKNRNIGYNGNLRAGVDSRARVNGGADINVREGKVNAFVSGNYNQRKSIMEGETERMNLIGNPKTNIFQENETTSEGYFGFIRGGIDYFLDNRNTITIAQMYNRGQFSPRDEQITVTDSLYDNSSQSTAQRISENNRNFHNLGSQISFKHLFPKADKEFTADINYNRSESETESEYTTFYFDESNSPYGLAALQKQFGKGTNEFYTAQADYVDPLTDKIKIEAGIRGAVRMYESANENIIYNYSSLSYEPVTGTFDDYEFTDQVYAAYATFMNKIKKTGYQIGLRAESSFYEGTLKETKQTFDNDYPVSLFPSGVISYELSEKQNVQLSYSRRINRPGFFQLLPYTDYSDSLNITRGNPALKPEFTNSLELSYMKTISRTDNLLASVYFKNTNDLITRYQQSVFDSALNKPIIINSYANADASYAYGVELSLKNTLTKWLEVSSNFNIYNSFIDGENIETNLTNERVSWFAKLNATIRLPKNFSIQLSGDYRSKTSLQQSSGGGGGRMFGGGGGGMFFGGSQSVAQGYNEPVYSIDVAVRKEFLKNRAASATLNVRDVFATQKNKTYSESVFFVQDTERIRDPQVVRLTLSYRFGKFDTSLFRRKNTNMNMENMQEGM